MNHWLLKSEPDAYSWQQLQKDGKGVWDGVRNYQARNHLMAMKKGDLAFFYHSNIGKEIVGVVQILKEHYPDPTTEDKRWVVVEVTPVKSLPKPIGLEQIKKDPFLQNIGLIRQSRLSVMPVSPEMFDHILQLAQA